MLDEVQNVMELYTILLVQGMFDRIHLEAKARRLAVCSLSLPLLDANLS
jgi:hypothetical protein